MGQQCQLSRGVDIESESAASCHSWVCIGDDDGEGGCIAAVDVVGAG